MQERLTRLVTAAIAGLATGGLLATSPANAADIRCAEQERCFGVAKAGKNDCATATSACAGTARQDAQKDAWMYVPKGSCAKIAGGSLTPPVMKK